MVILAVFLVAAISFGLGFWACHLLLKEEKAEINSACEAAIKILENQLKEIEGK